MRQTHENNTTIGSYTNTIWSLWRQFTFSYIKEAADMKCKLTKYKLRERASYEKLHTETSDQKRCLGFISEYGGQKE